MAVSIMKKLSVIALLGDADKITERLMWTGCVDLTSASAGTPQKDGAENPDPEAYAYLAELSQYTDSGEILRLNRAIARVDTAIDVLSIYNKVKKGLFAPKAEVVYDEFFAEGRDVLAEEAVSEACAAADRMAVLKADMLRYSEQLEALKPWVSYEFSLGEDRTDRTVTVSGSFPPATETDKIAAELQERYPAVLSIIGTDAAGIYGAVTVLDSEAESAVRYLTQNGFLRTAFGADVKSASAEIERIGALLASAKEEMASLCEKAGGLSENLTEIRCYHDVLTAQLSRAEAMKKLACMRDTVLITGWVPEKETKRVEKALAAFECAHCFEDPGENDDVPVLLSNGKVASNYEPVISLYSLPAYGEFDPTSIMSIFYTVIFGLMFADAGYGLLLVVLCLAALKLMKPTGSLKKFINLFMICGVACTVMGVIFGGYFGDLPTAVMQNMFGVENPPELALWFNPLNDPMTFLIISIAMGAVHLVAGMGVQFWLLCRQGHWFDAVCDIGSWYVLFAGIVLFLIPAASGIAMYVALAGALMIVLTTGRAEKNPIMKLMKGLLGLYGIVNYAADLLSYSRILSLGLASSVIASVFNILATMAGFTPVGIVMFIVIFTIGHLLNLAINLLGTFVHTSRLQYIEFFGKFYVNGGRPFSPLMPAGKYVRIKNDPDLI